MGLGNGRHSDGGDIGLPDSADAAAAPSAGAIDAPAEHPEHATAVPEASEPVVLVVGTTVEPGPAVPTVLVQFIVERPGPGRWAAIRGRPGQPGEPAGAVGCSGPGGWSAGVQR